MKKGISVVITAIIVILVALIVFSSLITVGMKIPSTDNATKSMFENLFSGFLGEVEESEKEEVKLGYKYPTFFLDANLNGGGGIGGLKLKNDIFFLDNI